MIDSTPIILNLSYDSPCSIRVTWWRMVGCYRCRFEPPISCDVFSTPLCCTTYAVL